MKKITFLFLFLGFNTLLTAQCLTAPIGQYPDPTDPSVPFVPTCDGITQNNIVTDGYAGEFSAVSVISGQTYTFGSSKNTDVVTISSDSGATAAAFGIGSVTWVATVTGEVWFYTNLNDGSCGTEAANRIRYVICGTPPSCLPPVVGITLSNITNTSATFAWTASTSNPANGYDYYYSTSNSAPTGSTTPSGTVGVGITSTNITSLLPDSTYYVWVRSICSISDSSPWSNIGTLRTLCDSVTEFSENFDASLDFPSCWSRVGTGGSTYILAPSAPFSSPNVLYIYGNADPMAAVPGKGLVAMPPVSNAGDGTHRLRFKTKGNFTQGGNLEVGYLTNLANANSFIPVQTFTTTSTSDYDSFTALLGNAPGSNKVLAFRHTGNPAYSILIDDVIWEAIPSCVEPTVLSSSNITLSSATISWTASTSIPANGYEYYYSNSNTAPLDLTTPSGNVGAGITSANLASLNSSTTYYFWVRSKCSPTSSSAWSAVSSFNTLCSVSTVPYSQDFETAIVPSMPLCTSIQNAGSGNNWNIQFNPGYGFTSNTLRYPWNQTNAANAWFYTNAIALTAGTSYTISYKYGNRSITFVEKMKVAYGLDHDASAMINPLADYPSIVGGTTTSTGNIDSVDFTPAITGNYYFGFNAYSDANQFDLLVDDISVTTTLAVPSFNNANFLAYPNPVKDVLNISFDKTISKVAIFNILGQEVMAKSINVNQSQIDMSNLSRGTYMIKVTSEQFTQTIKVVKE